MRALLPQRGPLYFFNSLLGGAAVLAPALRARSGWALVLLLVAVFPANLHMALNPSLFPDISSSVLYLRLPLHIPLIAWAYWATRPDPVVVDATRAGT